MARAAALVSGAICTAATAQTLPPVEAFGSLPEITEPELSPDGNHFAAIQSIDGKPVVVIYRVGAPPGTTPAVLMSPDEIVDGIEWVKNDRLAVVIKTSKKVSWDITHRLYTWYRTLSVNTEAKDAVVLMKGNPYLANNTSSASILDRDIADPDHIYMTLYTLSGISGIEHGFHLDLYRVNVRTGNEESIAIGGAETDRWYLDGNGHIVARNDETTRPLVDHLKIPDSGRWRELGSYDATADSGNGVIGLAEDGKALMRSVRDNASMAVLVRTDPTTGKDTDVYSNPAYDVDHAIVDEWTGRVIGAVFIGDRVEYHYFDAAREAFQKGLEAAFPGLSVYAVSMNLARDRAVVEVDGPKQPTAYYLVDRTTHAATSIGSAYPNLGANDLGEMKPYPYKARDGLDIPAYITLPPGRLAENLPAIVMPHGGPDARDAVGFDWWAQFLANRGYAVLQPNYRGSSGYGHKFTEAGLHQWGLKIQDDITDGVKKMIADGIADPKRICIVGASYGGYAALAGAAFTPDLYACAASFAGISDLPAMLHREREENGVDSSDVSFWTSRIGSVYDDSEQLRAASPARHADQVKSPILLMHGEGDTTVSIEQSELMNDALKHAGKKVTFIRFPGEDHYLNLADTRIRMLKALESFLAENIGH